MGSHLRWGHAYLCPSFLLSSSSFPDLKQFLNTHTHTHRAIFHCPSNLDSHIRYNIGSLASLPAVNCVVVREGRCDTREKLAQRGGHNAKRRRRPPQVFRSWPGRHLLCSPGFVSYACIPLFLSLASHPLLPLPLSGGSVGCWF